MSENLKILNIKQVAERLNLPLRTFHYWLKHDRCPIPHIADSQPKKWLTVDVDEWLKGQAGDK